MCNEHSEVKDNRGVAKTAGNGITLDVFGVAMLLEKERKVVFVDGRKARISATDRNLIIPPHIPFIAFEPNKYKTSTKWIMSYSYDVDGLGEMTTFEGFLLDGHVVSFEGIARDESLVDHSAIAPMTALGEFELCPSVITGQSKQVVGTLDLRNATTLKGADHGDQVHAISFGTVVRNWAEKITATFKVNGSRPKVYLRNGKCDVEIELLGDGPWRIMAGNVPAEEVMNVSPAHAAMTHDRMPLTHVELLFDLYHLGPAGVAGIPKPPECTNHAAHAHARLAGSGVHCGPPVKSGG